MKTQKKISTALASAALLAAAAAQAAPTISTATGTPYNLTGGVTSLSTGSTMGGMAVTVCFNEAQTDCEMQTWVNGSLGSGSAGTLGVWSLAINGGAFGGDTFNSPFNLQVDEVSDRSIWGFSMFGAGGFTAFDLSTLGEGTPGSQSGKTFQWISGDILGNQITVTYSDLLTLDGAPHAGDLYLRMTVVFKTAMGPGAALEFVADTDSLNGTITPGGTNPVSAPGTLALAGLALLGLGVGRRRAQRAG